MAFVIYSEDKGVYLGRAWSLGFWSMLDPAGLSSAVCFDSMADAHSHMAGWNSRPSDCRLVEVESGGEHRASRESCVRAGLPDWEPDGSGLATGQPSARKLKPAAEQPDQVAAKVVSVLERLGIEHQVLAPDARFKVRNDPHWPLHVANEPQGGGVHQLRLWRQFGSKERFEVCFDIDGAGRLLRAEGQEAMRSLMFAMALERAGFGAGTVVSETSEFEALDEQPEVPAAHIEPEPAAVGSGASAYDFSELDL